MAITWTKFNGTWALRSETELDLGSAVEVARRDGETTLATPVALLWSGKGVWIYRVPPRSRGNGGDLVLVYDPVLDDYYPTRRRNAWHL